MKRQRQKKRSHFSPKDDTSFLFLVQKFIWLRQKRLFNENNVNESVKLHVSDKNVQLRLAPINLHILTCKNVTFIAPAAKT